MTKFKIKMDSSLFLREQPKTCHYIINRSFIWFTENCAGQCSKSFRIHSKNLGSLEKTYLETRAYIPI